MIEIAPVRFSALRDFRAAARKRLLATFPARNSVQRLQLASQVRVVLSESDVTVFEVTRGESKEIGRTALAIAERGESPLPSGLATREIVVVLSATEVLRRTVHLPIGAARNLRHILRHELDRHSPIDPAQVYFDHCVNIQGKTENKLEVDLRIIKRSSIERAIAISRALGLEPVSVEIGDDPMPLKSAELPLKRSAVVRSQVRRWAVPALSILIFVLAIATVTAAGARRELALTTLDTRINEARARAAAVQKLRDEIVGAEKRSGFLAGEKRNPMAVQALLEATRAIPDGTWVYSFQLNGREVRIRGFSPAASALIAAFDKSPFFANAQFRAPLTQGPQSGVERFDLSVDLTGDRS